MKRWGKCARCGIIIEDHNLGGCIEAEEIIVCNDCAEKHSRYLINDIEEYKKGKDFHNVLTLRKKRLWLSEKMGHLFDNADKSIQESVTDYDDLNQFELQLELLCLEEDLINGLLMDEDGFPDINKDPELNKLRLRVRNEHSKIVSYIDKEEYFSK